MPQGLPCAARQAIRKASWVATLVWTAYHTHAFAQSAAGKESAAASESVAFEERASFAAEDARQGVAVDAGHVYVVGSRSLAKFTRVGTLVKRREYGALGIAHLDSAMVFRERIYCAHSNFPRLPMTSSVEVFDTRTLKHVASHSLGRLLGSLTWLDRHGGHFWGTFANYDIPGKSPDGELSDLPYGHTRNTTLVRFDSRFRVVQSWIFPPTLLAKLAPMSNSGGSFGPDGRLYLSGHDLPELYVVSFPRAGSELILQATLPIAIRGQGFAWDRTRPGTLYGIRRAPKGSPAKGQVVRFRQRPESK